jgi:hypothetical protein
MGMSQSTTIYLSEGLNEISAQAFENFIISCDYLIAKIDSPFRLLPAALELLDESGTL